MITFLKTLPTGLAVIPEPSVGSWINVVDPTPDELAHLGSIGVPEDYINYPLDMDERARTERENGDILIVLRVPFYQGDTSDIPYSTMPLGIILTPGNIVTITKHPTKILDTFTTGKVRDLSTSKFIRFVLLILLRTADMYLANVREINKKVDVLEDKLERSTLNEEVLELLKYQKSLTYFTTALKSNELMMERLQRSRLFNMYPEDEDLLEDVLIENRQAIEMTTIAGNILSQMMDAYASIISNNLNVVMKLLASITIIASIPTMIFSFYGMNVNLPLESHPLAYIVTLLVSMVLAAAAIRYFRRHDWV